MNIQDYFMVNEKLNLTPEQLADINENNKESIEKYKDTVQKMAATYQTEAN